LTGRIHRTFIGHSLSDVAYISSGVVQGSCLGPLLFLTFCYISMTWHIYFLVKLLYNRTQMVFVFVCVCIRH